MFRQKTFRWESQCVQDLQLFFYGTCLHLKGSFSKLPQVLSILLWFSCLTSHLFWSISFFPFKASLNQILSAYQSLTWRTSSIQPQFFSFTFTVVNPEDHLGCEDSKFPQLQLGLPGHWLRWHWGFHTGIQLSFSFQPKDRLGWRDHSSPEVYWFLLYFCCFSCWSCNTWTYPQ